MLLARHRHYPASMRLAAGGRSAQQLPPPPPRPWAPPRCLAQRTVAYAQNEKRFRKPLQTDRQRAQRRASKLPALKNVERQLAKQAAPGTKAFTKGVSSLLELLRVDSEETKLANAQAEDLRKALYEVPGLAVSRVHVGGSAGRRTNVSERFDVDYIAYVAKVDHAPADYIDWCNTEWHTKLRLTVLDHLRSAGWTVQDDETRYALQLKKGGLEFDLLVLPDRAVGAKDPVREQHKALMASVYGNSDRARYTVLRQRADSPALTEFAKGQPETVKSVARLVKAWVKLGLGERGLLARWKYAPITSVALEVMAYAAYEELKEQVGANAVQGDALFLQTLKVIQQAVNEKRVVMVDAGEWGYRPDVGMRCGPKNWPDGDHRHPVRIIHFTDPTCNLAAVQEGRGPPDWAGLAREASVLEDTMQHGTLNELLMDSTLTPVYVEFGAARPLPDGLWAMLDNFGIGVGGQLDWGTP